MLNIVENTDDSSKSGRSAGMPRVDETGIGRAGVGRIPVLDEERCAMTKHGLRFLAGPLGVLTALVLVLAGCGTDSGGSNGGSASTIQIWEGWTGAEAKTFTHL